jgi:hypothetical protein
MTEPGTWDDVLMDTIGSVEAVETANVLALAQVLRYGNLAGIVVLQAKLLAELLQEVGAQPGAFRQWAPQAASRRT